ncbi:unnamed protein product [Caenorhabditis auriculariae]|uniref:Tafazzin family protein n=1 Tax=Caenorhabditis auriculariae TaxID=2777116 RepID=A0A8S1H8V2_9PELO|nr:unnamed protein product [Caenorhabditis auriculariae]
MTGTQADRSNDRQGFRFAWPFPKHPSALYKMKSYLTMSFISSLSKVMFLGGANKLVAHNKERFLNLLQDKSRPLLTVSNHRSNIDDPLMWAILTYREFLRSIDRNRYTLAAHNICFTKQFHTTMFSLGRCVPIVRGEGVYQKAMDFCVEQLDQNQWVHIFPEGRVVDIQTEPLRLKWGVGRLIMDVKKDPIVLPIWCKNMEKVWPVKPPYYPRFGHKVDIFIGEPFDLASLKREVEQCEDLTTEDRRKILTDEIQRRIYLLGEQVGDVPKGAIEALAQRHKLLPSQR